MKKVVSVILTSAMVLSLMACGGNAGGNAGSSVAASSESSAQSSESSAGENGEANAPADYSFNFRVGSGLSTQHPYDTGFYTPLMEAITADTGGQVTFDYFHTGELVAYGSEYEALSQGIVDMAASFTPTYDASRFPLTEIIALPAIGVDQITMNTAAYNLFHSTETVGDTGKTYYELMFTDKDLVGFISFSVGEYYLLTTGHSFNKLEDFNPTVTMRSPSRPVTLLLENLNLTPITLVSSEQYDAMSRGTIQGITLCATWCDNGLEDLIKYVLKSFPLSYYTYFTMTTDTWNSLPEELQNYFIEESDRLFFEGWQDMVDYSETNFAALGDDCVIEDISELDPEVQQFINEAVAQTWKDWIDSVEQQGYEGKAIALMYRDELIKAGATLDQTLMELDDYVPNK